MSEKTPTRPESISGQELADLIDAGHDQVTLKNLGFVTEDGRIFNAPIMGFNDILSGVKHWSEALRGESKFEPNNDRAKVVLDAINGTGKQTLFEVSFRGPISFGADGEMDIKSMGFSLGQDGFLSLNAMMLALGQGKTEVKYGKREDLYHPAGERWVTPLPNGRELVFEFDPDAEFGKTCRFYADDVNDEAAEVAA